MAKEDGNKKPERNNHSTNREESVSIGAWVALYLAIVGIGLIPIIGAIIVFIILIVMAISNDINRSLKNWAQAMLILMVIAFLIVFLFFGSVS